MNGATVDADDLIAQRSQVLHGEGLDPSASALPGGFAIARRGNGQVVADSRAYIYGDDLRHVDRGATARTGDLHVRTFHEERDRVTFLVADFRPSMLWGMRRALRSVTAAHALARIGWQATEAGGRVGLCAITSDELFVIPSRARVSGMLAVIGGLVRAHAHAVARAAQDQIDPPLGKALDGIEKLIPRGAEVVIATALDARGDGFATELGALSRHRRPRFLVIEDQALNDLPAGYYPLRRPGGRKARAIFRQPSEPARPCVTGLEAYQVDYIDAAMALGDGR